jgi:putative hydrolase of the HAD superfamily
MGRPVLLLDLGGVLADLGDPVAAMGLGMTPEAFWQTWANSRAVRAFETGELQARDFYPRVAAELGLQDGSDFERRFQAWRLRPFKGAESFVERAAERFELALLSNTNEVHWHQVTGSTPLFSNFSRLFLSYETGRFKPEADAFSQVIDCFGVAPAEVTFYDDTVHNVEAARALGIEAYRVSGLDELMRHLDRR